LSASSSDVIELQRLDDRVTAERGAAGSAVLPGAERPSRIGRYVVLETIGRGGMGVVCTAYDPKLDRKVALKLLRQSKSDRERTESRRARMLREAQALAKLSHPNVITVHDVDTFGDRLYIAMEYVEGCTISQWLRKTPRTWREIVDVFVHAARGLAAAHEAGIVHRDFKPSNVLLGDDGRVRVLDFGLAKTSDELEQVSHDDDAPDSGDSLRDARSKIAAVLGSATDLHLTQAGRAVGTPAYMAPEQLRSERVGPHTDQFSFGIALYEALYGRLPFGTSVDIRDLIDRVTEGRVRDPPRDAAVPGWIHRVVVRALQVDPASRFPSMNALMAALTDDPVRRRRRWMAGGLVVLLAAGGGAIASGAVARPPLERCTGAASHIGEVWNEARRGEVQRAFLSTGRTYAPRTAERVLAELDAWAAEWTASHTSVCEATNVRAEQSEALMDHRMACLDRGRAELDALVGVFEHADTDVVLHAPSAVRALNEPAACALDLPGAGEVLPDDPVLIATIREVDQRIARARALEFAGRYEDALELAQQAREDAEGVDHAGTTARAMFQEGLSLRRVRKGDTAAQRLQSAIQLAARAGLWELEARAWVFLVTIEGTQAERFDRAIAHVIAAESAIERAGRPLELRALLAQHVAGVYFQAQRYDDAIAPATEAVALWEELRGPHSLEVANARNDRAAILVGRRELDAAEREFRAAQEVVERTYGSEHPRVASGALNLGTVLRQRGDDESALTEYLRALAILRKVGSPDDLSLTGPLLGLAQIEVARAPAAAREHLEEALRILEAHPQPSASRLAIALRSLAELDVQEARHAQAGGDEARSIQSFESALGRLQRAATLYAELHGEQHASVRRVQRESCDVLGRLGRLSEARRACDAAVQGATEGDEDLRNVLTAYARSLGSSAEDRAAAEVLLRLAAGPPDDDSSPATTARAELALASVLWAEPRRRDDAHRAAARAAALASTAHDDALAPEIDRWAREHR
jgi:eukaryotic-like serine/threonine-protein kinase